MKKLNKWLILGISVVLLSFSLWANPVLAHRNPEGCSGSGLGINLFTDKSEVHIGDTILFSVKVFNGLSVGPIVCDASDITASITTPDGQIHNVPLSRTTLANGESDTYTNIISYIAETSDVKLDGTLTSTAIDTGIIHQNDTNSIGGGDQGVNITIIADAPPVVPVIPAGGGGGGGGGGGSNRIIPFIGITKIPNPLALPLGPGLVTYDYTVWNVGGQQALKNVTVIDDKCSPVAFLSGDINNNNKLDITENWKYNCTMLLSTTTINTATTTGYSDDSYNQSATAIATSSVIVGATSSPVFIPKLPNTGFFSLEKTVSSRTVLSIGNGTMTSLNLIIPKINVNTSLESVGLTTDGSIGAPKGPSNASLFSLGPRPGEKGSSIISGHYGWKDSIQAVFDNLNKLQKGDKVYIKDEKGIIITYIVSETRIYRDGENAPDVFNSNDDNSHLNLITCGGNWNKINKSYSNRLVVFTDRE